MNAKSFIFKHFTHGPTAQFMSFLPHKNMRFMATFHQPQFINKNQRNLVSYLTQHNSPAPYAFHQPSLPPIASLPAKEFSNLLPIQKPSNYCSNPQKTSSKTRQNYCKKPANFAQKNLRVFCGFRG